MKEMRYGLRKIAIPLLATAVLGSVSCEKVRNENAKEAEKAYTPGTPKTLSVILTAKGQGNYVREKRFYDIDGDGKTVEQYVELYGIPSEGDGVMPTQTLVNLIRGESHPQFQGEGLYSYHGVGKDPEARRMTTEEEKDIDEEYQIMLRKRGE